MLYEMLPAQIAKPVKKITQKVRCDPSLLTGKHRNNHDHLNRKLKIDVPSNETARLLILKQIRILNTDRKDIEYDRFTSLAKRILEVPYAFISFVDFERIWIKSAIGLHVEDPNIPREKSIDNLLVFPEAPEIKIILDFQSHSKYEAYRDAIPLPGNDKMCFYTGVALSVEGFRVGVLSVIDTQPREHLSMDNRQNLLDLAAAISHLLRERRLKYLRFKKERANLMLGLNHNLRTPLMSLTLVSEMLRSEVKRLALSSVKDQNTLRNRISESGRIFDFEDNTNSQAHQNHNNNYGSSAKEITDGMFASSRPISHGTSHCVSTQHTPDLPCMNLFGDLQTSVQQLGLFVEMGLILGKITSGLSVLSDGTYESILCDILKTYERVRLLTERIGRSQNVVWAIDRTNLTNGLHYSHPDVLMFVLISVLTQLLPHSDFIRVKGTFVSVEEVSRTLDDESDLLAVNAVIESVAPVVVIGNVGLLVTEIEAFGDTANLAEIVSKLAKTPEDSERTSSTGSQASSNAATSDDGKLVARFDEFINPDVEEFGGSVFALGNLLDNVLGGSTYLPTETGCIFSFSIPCRIEAKTPTIPEETSEDASMASSRSMKAPSSSRYLNMQDDEESVRAVITKEEIASIMKNGSGSDNDSDRSSEKEDVPETISALSVPSIKIPPRPPSPARIIIKEPIVVPQSTDPIIVVSNNFRDSVVMSPATETDKVVKDQVLETIQNLKSRATEHDRHRMLQVLLVDDSISVQKILKVWLSKNHCNVTTALNGAVALDLMKVNVYDIIFMDFLMPVMDGLTCIRLFKEFCQGKQDTYTSSPKNQPPTSEFIEAIKESWIVGLSATALPEDQEMAFSLGMHVFCTKPVDMQALKILLEAKRLRLPYLTIQQLASSNRELSMTTVQRDLAVDLMLPYPNTSPSSSNEATHTVASPATSGKLLKDRSELKDAFNQLETGKANIFGSFYFNNNNNSMQ